MYSRSGLDWTAKYARIAKALKQVPVANAVFDGEVVYVDTTGRTDFQALQNALKMEDARRLVYYIFDLLFLDGEDLREKPLWERKERLKEVLKATGNSVLRYSEHVQGQGPELLKAACKIELEGLISKNRDAEYVSARTDSWLKSKCHKHQEFVIGGYSLGEGSRGELGSLLLGVYEKKQFKYVGRVGTGFTELTLKDLLKKLKIKKREDSPFDLKSPRERGLKWVQPDLVAEITFANWTTDGVLRQAVFHGLREDKSAVEIHVEKEKARPRSSTKKPTSIKKHTEKLAVTNPEKLVFKKEKITKLELAQYYDSIADLILPYLRDRPLNLLRCPDEAGRNCFFQKHVTGKVAQNLTPVRIKEKSGTKTYVTVDAREGLWDLAQMRAFEIHVWGSRAGELEHPDQIVMDFDPGPGISWKQTVHAAFDLKKILDQIKLKSFVKVSGGKGVHVHIPVAPIYSWDQIKDFSRTLGEAMQQQNPDLYTVTMAKNQREGRIFVDYLRNGRGATAVAPYSVRMRAKSAVAMPVSWEQLKKIKSSDAFDLRKAVTFLKRQKKDPWKGYNDIQQKISILKPVVR